MSLKNLKRQPFWDMYFHNVTTHTILKDKTDIKIYYFNSFKLIYGNARNNQKAIIAYTIKVIFNYQ